MPIVRFLFETAFKSLNPGIFALAEIVAGVVGFKMDGNMSTQYYKCLRILQNDPVSYADYKRCVDHFPIALHHGFLDETMSSISGMDARDAPYVGLDVMRESEMLNFTH